MKKIEKLRKFIIDNLDDLDRDCSSGSYLDLPPFELHALDYLKFAEQELENKNPQNLINCVAHLKRATDCQIDTFLHVCNLYTSFNSRNLKFDKKLDFLKEVGIFSSRSLSRFNTIRNKMEHHYEIPKIEDIEVYYDLVSALAGVIQGTINTLINFGSILEFLITGPRDERIGDFSIEYKYEKPEIHATWKLNGEQEDIIVDLSDPFEFAFCFRILLLLGQRECFVSDNYIISQIKIDI